MAISIKRFFRTQPGILIGVNCLVFLLFTADSLAALLCGSRPLLPLQWVELPARFGLFLSRPWTIISYMFTQLGVLHLLFNMLWLWWFGSVLMLTVPPRTLVRTYLLGGICGGAAFMLLAAAGAGGSWLAGSSAAVIAVMTLAAFRSPGYSMHLLFLGEVKLKWVAVVTVAIMLLGGSGNAGGVAAHCGGLAYGIAAGLLMRRRAGRKRRPTAGAMRSGMKRYAADSRRLDALLDKIRTSGYDSLSRAQKRELDALSESLGKHPAMTSTDNPIQDEKE